MTRAVAIILLATSTTMLTVAGIITWRAWTSDLDIDWIGPS